MVENLGLLAPLFGGEEMHFDQFVGSETPSHQIRSVRNLLLKRFPSSSSSLHIWNLWLPVRPLVPNIF